VLYAHFVGSGSIDTGRLGVDVFFVLSGFLMSKILFIKRVPLKEFYKRRVSRILPAFFLFVIIIYVTDYFFIGAGEWKNFFYTVLFLRSYLPGEPDIWNTAIPIGHLWSLNVEEHCYILLSTFTLLRFLRGREGVALLISGVMAIVIHIAYVKIPLIAPPAYSLRTEVAASHLLLSAGYYLVRHHFVKYVKAWMPVVTFFGAALCYTEIAPWWASFMISPFLLAFTVNHLSETYEIVHSLLSSAVLRLMGIWSYSIYLWQQPFHSFKGELGNDLFALFFALTAGLLSFYCFENPMRAWMNRNWK